MKTTLSPLKHRQPPLTARDVATLEGLSHDGFQSLRARKRAHALLLLSKGLSIDSVLFRTGLTAKSLESMFERFKTHGVHGAIFDRPHIRHARLYDYALLAKIMKDLLGSRPPPGMLRWSLEALTTAVRARLPVDATLSCEIVRQVLKKNLGIKSIRFVEPYWFMQVKKAG